jgi:phage shock protein C
LVKRRNEPGGDDAPTGSEEIAMTLSEELNRVSELHQRGTLNDDEFARAKARLLNGTAGFGPSGAAEPFVAAVNALQRSRDDRWIAGVCGGLARATGMAPWAWRLIFTLLLLCGGAGALLYLVLWVFVPSE